MRQVHWEYNCDWCTVSVNRQVETMPDGWRLVLIGTDSRGPKQWQSKRHICEECCTNTKTLLDAWDEECY